MYTCFIKVKQCHYCQAEAHIPHNHERELQPICPPSHPWKHMGIDIISDFGSDSDEFRHIFVAVCYLSKFVCAYGLKSKRSSEVICKLKEIFLTYGVPNIVQHDQGPEFTSKVVKHLRITNNYLYVLYKEIQFVRQCIELITTYRNTRNSHNSSKLIIDLLLHIALKRMVW